MFKFYAKLLLFFSSKIWYNFNVILLSYIVGVAFVMLDQMILDELKNTDLNGITVLSVVTEPEAIQVVFEMPPTQVEFRIDGDCQFQILSVTYNGVVYDDPRYLAQFHNVVLDVMIKVKLVETKKRIEYEAMQQQSNNALQLQEKNIVQGRLDTLALREERIKKQERQLDLKEQEIKDREKLLRDKEEAIALERRVEELKYKEDALKNREKFDGILRDVQNWFKDRIEWIKDRTEPIRSRVSDLFQKSRE